MLLLIAAPAIAVAGATHTWCHVVASVQLMLAQPLRPASHQLPAFMASTLPVKAVVLCVLLWSDGTDLAFLDLRWIAHT